MVVLNPLKRRRLKATVFALLALALPLVAQSLDANDEPALLSDGARAPLMLFINGSGRTSPFHDGEFLDVGRGYRMVAIPQAGYVFTGWGRVNVFTIVEYVVDESGNISTTTSTVLSPIPGLRRNRILEFGVQPSEVLFEIPNVRTISMNEGWQANFLRETK